MEEEGSFAVGRAGVQQRLTELGCGSVAGHLPSVQRLWVPSPPALGIRRLVGVRRLSWDLLDTETRSQPILATSLSHREDLEGDGG